jgi:hypothetical protein
VTRWQAAHDKAGRTEAEERVLYLRVLYLAVGAGALLGASGVLVSAAAVRGVLGPLTTLGEPSGVWRIPPSRRSCSRWSPWPAGWHGVR